VAHEEEGQPDLRRGQDPGQQVKPAAQQNASAVAIQLLDRAVQSRGATDAELRPLLRRLDQRPLQQPEEPPALRKFQSR